MQMELRELNMELEEQLAFREILFSNCFQFTRLDVTYILLAFTKPETKLEYQIPISMAIEVATFAPPVVCDH